LHKFRGTFQFTLGIGDPPMVLAELLCEPSAPKQYSAANHPKLLLQKLTARLADALISQSCIDPNVALIARNGDFRYFANHCRLRLA
jgi:hypothetical protein